MAAQNQAEVSVKARPCASTMRSQTRTRWPSCVASKQRHSADAGAGRLVVAHQLRRADAASRCRASNRPRGAACVSGGAPRAAPALRRRRRRESARCDPGSARQSVPRRPSAPAVAAPGRATRVATRAAPGPRQRRARQPRAAAGQRQQCAPQQRCRQRVRPVGLCPAAQALDRRVLHVVSSWRRNGLITRTVKPITSTSATRPIASCHSAAQALGPRFERHQHGVAQHVAGEHEQPDDRQPAQERARRAGR